jgi:hypothetical protein
MMWRMGRDRLVGEVVEGIAGRRRKTTLPICDRAYTALLRHGRYVRRSSEFSEICH